MFLDLVDLHLMISSHLVSVCCDFFSRHDHGLEFLLTPLGKALL